MPFDGNGHYSLPAGNPVVTGTVINSTTTNNTLTDISTALSTTLTKDGQTTPTGNLPMGGYKHTGAADGTSSGDYTTVGQLAASGGSALSGFLQADTGATARTSQAKMREVEVNVKDFGGLVDGSTDDIAAWEAACAYVSGLGGGVVSMPQGTSIISRLLVVPASVRLRGRGKRGSTIKAGAAFSTITTVVQLGATTAFAFDCRLEDMAVDCNNRAPIGITGPCIQEGSGARNVLVTRYTSTAIDIDETSGTQYADHFIFDDIEAYCATAAVSSKGFHYKGLKNGGQIRRMTVSANGAGLTQANGVHIEGTGAAGCHVQVIGLNVENHADAAFVDTNGGATIIGVALIVTGTNVVRINTQQGVEVIRSYKSAGTNNINNVTLGDTITDANVGSYIQVAAGGGIQAFYSGGRTGNTPSVSGSDNPVHTVKTTSTSTGTQKARYRLLDGNNDGWALQFAGNGLNDPFELIPITAGSDGSVVFRVTDLGAIQAMQTTNGPAGSITLGAAASTVVSNTSVTANSKVYLQATNAAAATLMSGSKALYHDTAVNSAGGSFTVKTADATAAAGTETFSYWMVN